ncbi:MAG: flagellar basal body-associated FliL family protein [Nitrospina sp.]|nr:flagellar basal body-associated FliL family protein [Nitrospina sp.]
MAEDQGAPEKEQDLTTDEAAELERLLDDAGGEEGAAGGGLKGLQAKFKKILGNKKLLMIYGGGLLVLLLAIGVGAYFLLAGEDAEVVPLEEQAVEEEIVEEEEVIVSKVNIYKLEPFFLPIRDEGKETGRFISISANLLLSNRVLNLEIDKILPLVRKNIYNILRRKRPSDFTLKRSRTEERIKKEILVASNALLLSGTGTITDVFFTRFMVK